MTLLRDLVDVVDDPEAFRENPHAFTERFRLASDAELDSLRATLAVVDRFDTVRRFGLREAAHDPETYSEPTHGGLLSASLLVHAVAAEFDTPRPEDPASCDAEMLERLHAGARRALHYAMFEHLSAMESRESSIAAFAAATSDLHWGPPAWSEDRRDLLGRLFFPHGHDFVADVCSFGWADLCRVVDRLMGAAEMLTVLSAIEPSPFSLPIAALQELPAELLDDPTPIDEATLSAVLDWLATPLGSEPIVDVRSSIRAQRFRPALIHGDEFSCPHPDLVWWAVRHRLETELKREGRKLRRYERHRRALVETEVANRISAVVSPDARINGATYRIGDQEFELDAVLVVGGAVIVIEAKGAAVSERAWSGHGDRLHRDLDSDTVGYGSRQVGRFVRHLRQVGTVTLTNGKHSVEIVSDRVDDVFAVVALIDHIGPLTADSLVLEGAGVELDPDALPCVVDLDTLATMVELLDTPWQLLHYLHRRRATAARHDYSAIEELDLVMLYIDQNLYYDDVAPGIVAVGSQTDALDEWDRFQRGQRSTTAKKPSQSIPIHVRRLLDGLSRERPDGWVAAVFHILDHDDAARKELNRHLKQCRQRVRADRQHHDLTTVLDKTEQRKACGLSVVLGVPEDTTVATRAWFLAHLNGIRHTAGFWIGIACTCSNDVITVHKVIRATPPYTQVVPPDADLTLPAHSSGRTAIYRKGARRTR